MEPPPLPPLQIERAVAPIAFPDAALEKVLRGHLFPTGSPLGACESQGGARYVYNRFDLNGDRQPETLVALLGQQRCGKEGCPLMLLRSMGDTLIPLQTIGGLHTAVVISERSSHGWRDLILPRTEGPGGWPPNLLAHDGLRYPAPLPPGGPATLESPVRGVSALAIKSRTHLVQGHALPCPSPTPDQGRTQPGNARPTPPRAPLRAASWRPSAA